MNLSARKKTIQQRGGEARAKKLSPARRKAIAKKAAAKRWGVKRASTHKPAGKTAARKVSAQVAVYVANRWIHVSDALPDFGDYVLVGGMGTTDAPKEWATCGERKLKGGGSWVWDLEDGFTPEDLEWWMPIDPFPPTRLKLKHTPAPKRVRDKS